VTTPTGLWSGNDLTAYTGDVTTGQALVGYGQQTGGSPAGGVGGLCVIEGLPAGTYTISIQYKATSGSVTAKNRRLKVRTESFA
jgi:hypothetical protein